MTGYEKTLAFCAFYSYNITIGLLFIPQSAQKMEE